MCAAIAHFPRKVGGVVSLEGPNAGWIIEALEQAMRKHGLPKRMIPDQASVCRHRPCRNPETWNIKPRFGAAGKHGSIALTERVIKTLEYESLRCIPLIDGFDHLTLLCTEFASWHTIWRPHTTLEVFRPGDLCYSGKPETPERDAKSTPSRGERHVFAETRLTACRLKNAA